MDTSNKKVIAICADGHGAGKSTLARFIQDYYTAVTKKVCAVASFADIIKEAAMPFVGYEGAYQNKDKPMKILGGKTPRNLLICLGENIKKDFGPEFFARYMIDHEIEDSNYELYIIDDLRYPAEVKALSEKYGKNLFVIYVHNHRAEKCECEGLISLDVVDWQAWNTGTLGQLYDEAVEIVSQVVLDNE